MSTLVAASGFEFGTLAGIATGTAGSRLFDSLLGAPTVTATSPRTGTYCLEAITTAQAAVTWDTNTIGASKTTIVVSFYFYVATNPTAGSEAAHIDTAANVNSLNIEYFGTTGKLNIFDTVSATTSQSQLVLSTGTWYRIDVRANVAANPWVVNWQIDGVTQPLFQPANVATTIAGFALGNKYATAFSGTFRYDDALVSVTSADYPIGAHKVVIARPDIAKPVVLNGTSANWNTFSGTTPTEIAWNAVTAMTNVADLPVLTGASQTGLGQVTLLSTDNAEIPLTAYQVQPGEAVLGGRAEVVGWQASATSATIGFRSWNGTTETSLLAATAFTNLGNSTATPAWLAKMLTPADVSMQPMLNNLALRVGFSTDATPHIGVQAAYVELAIATGIATDYGIASIAQPPGLFLTPTSLPQAWSPARPISTAVDWVITAGQPVETDLAQPVTAINTHVVVMGQPTETDLAQPVALIQSAITVTLGQATELDTAQPMTRDVDPSIVLWFVAPGLFSGPGSGPVPWQGIEVAMAVDWLIVTGQPSETGLAQPITAINTHVVTASQAAETDLAQPITPVVAAHVVTVNQAGETDTSQPVAAIKTQVVVLGQAVSTEVAQGLTGAKVATLGQPVELDTAQPVGEYVEYPADFYLAAPGLFGAPNSVSASWPGDNADVTPVHVVAVGQAAEADLSQPVTVIHAWTVIVGQTTEIDLAQSVTPINTHVVTLGQCIEVDLAQLVAAIKTPHTVTLGQATETDLAQPIHASHPITVLLGQCQEIDLALLVSFPTGSTVATFGTADGGSGVRLASSEGGSVLVAVEGPQPRSSDQASGSLSSQPRGPAGTSSTGGSSLGTTDSTTMHDSTTQADTLSSHDDAAGGLHDV